MRKFRTSNIIDRETQRLNQWVRSGTYKRAYATAELARKVELERRLKELKDGSLLKAQGNRLSDTP